MPTITLTLPVAGTRIDAGLHATNYSVLQALLNGGLDGANFPSGSVLALGDPGVTVGGDALIRANGAGKVKLVVGSTVGVTDASGLLTIPFGFTFAAVPTVICINGDATAVPNANVENAGTTTTTQFVAKSTALSTTIRVNWFAYGIEP